MGEEERVLGKKTEEVIPMEEHFSVRVNEVSAI
jgi:hypothetical protein